MSISFAVASVLAGALSVSILLNGILVWYVRKLIQNLVLYTEGVDSITDSIDDKLVELERFSRKDLILNDPDVAYVFNMIKECKAELEVFRDDFTIVDIEEDENNFGEEINER